MTQQQRPAAAPVRKHPRQWLHSPSRGLSAAVHTAGFASFAYSFHYLVDNPNAINESYGWHLQYLTIVGLSLALATFVFGILADLTLSPRLFAAKNAMSVTSAPMEVLISCLYWTIRGIDQSLVIPDWLEPLPILVDLNFHAAPALLLVIDLLFFSPPWTISAVPALGLSSTIAVAYWFWVEQCYSKNGFYPYPIFEINKPLRITLFVVSAFVMTGSTLTLKWLYASVNGVSPGLGKSRPSSARAKRS